MRSQNGCAETGLNCETCVASTARELAQTCRGLRGRMVAQLFVQLYPEPACARMVTRFATEYREFSQLDARAGRDDWEDIPAAARVDRGFDLNVREREAEREAVLARPARVMFAVA